MALTRPSGAQISSPTEDQPTADALGAPVPGIAPTHAEVLVGAPLAVDGTSRTGAREPAWTGILYDRLRGNGYEAIAYVPDEGTGKLLPTLETDPAFTVVSVTREEEGVGLLTGAQLGGQRGALLIQASGVGNLINALASVNVACNIPLLLVIGERGGLFEFNPCQVPGGRAAPDLLAAVGVQSFRVNHVDELADTLDGATTLAFSTRQPVGVVLTTAMQKGCR